MGVDILDQTVAMLVDPYPKYGRRCLEGECRCPEPICDPVAGCAISKYKNVIIIPFNSYANVIY